MSEFELLDRKERALRAEADVLDKELAEIHRRRDTVGKTLQRIAHARATLEELLMDEPEAAQESAAGAGHAGPRADHTDSDGCEATSGVTHSTAGDESGSDTRSPVDMEEARRRAVTLLATSGRKMRARAIAEAIGEDVSRPARVETTRGRLKTLVAEGTLMEEPPGVFFIATSERADGAEPTHGPEEAV